MHTRYLAKAMSSMTRNEATAVRDRDAQSISVPRTKYTATTDARHDKYGCDTRDHRVFDAAHSEDVFPY